MLSVFGRAFDEIATYTARQPDDRYLSSLLSRDTFVAIAAFAGLTVIGGLAAYVLPKSEAGAPSCTSTISPSTRRIAGVAWPRR